MNGLIIKELVIISENEKGSTCRIDLNGQSEGILGFRKAGSIFGGHYHTGKSPSKVPEKLCLLQGVLILNCRNTQTNDVEIHHIKAPSVLEIQPFIWHKIEAITDLIFVEMNSIEEHIANTIYSD